VKRSASFQTKHANDALRFTQHILRELKTMQRLYDFITNNFFLCASAFSAVNTHLSDED